MDDSTELHYILPAAIFLVATIGMLAWQVLRLLGRGGLDGVGLIRLICSVFVLGIMCWVGFTALQMWT